MKLHLTLIDLYNNKKQNTTYYVDDIDDSREILEDIENTFSGYQLDYSLQDDFEIVDQGSMSL